MNNGAKGLISRLVVAATLGLAVPGPAVAAPSCDADGDGYLNATRKCGGNDCNDADAAVNPGAPEICGDGIDNDCDGIDEICGGADLVCQSGPQADASCTSSRDCGVCTSGNTGGLCTANGDCNVGSGKNKVRGTCEIHQCVQATTPPACTDADSDGFFAEGGDCGTVDCDDADGDINPGAVEVCGNGVDDNCSGTADENCSASLPMRISVAGDSISRGFAADCSCNTNFFCLLCLLGGDQPEHSWFDGGSSAVNSVLDRYRAAEPLIGSSNTAVTGAEMLGADSNFAAQADAILAQTPLPEHVEVQLGGNDICNRGCTDAANCADPLYTDAEWTAALRLGLDKLVAGLPEGATVILHGVPRVQDLRAAGLAKQAASSNVDCEGVWLDYDICPIATQGAALNGESIGQRLAAVAARQQSYNAILRSEAAAYNLNSNGRNPRGIEVLASYVDENTPSFGTFSFGAADIDGGDCFHPSLSGQNTAAGLSWDGNPDNPGP